MRRTHIRRCFRWPSIPLALCAVALAAASASAQAGGQEPTTRAGQLEAERAAQAAEVTPPKRTGVERLLYWYDNQDVLSRITAGWHGVHVVGGRFPAGAGLSAGLGYSVGGDTGLGLVAEAAGSTRGYKRGGITIGARSVGGAPVDVSVFADAYEYPQEDFFGIGPHSRVDDRTNYLLSNVEGGASVMWRPRHGLEVGAGVTYLSPRIGSGTDTRMPSTEERFAPSTLPGYLAETDFVRTDFGVAIDRRDSPNHPHAGGRYSARLSDYRDLDSVGFRSVEVEAQQYVPIPDRYRTLALRAIGTFTNADRGSDVPFYWQPTLGGANVLRGFREFRFQDRNSVAVTAEYRWEAWWALDGAFFVDAGTVAPVARALSLRNVEVSYGVGLRLHSNSAVITRLDLAFSREGFIPLLRFDHVF